jgi:hypothetical protein
MNYNDENDSGCSHHSQHCHNSETAASATTANTTTTTTTTPLHLSVCFRTQFDGNSQPICSTPLQHHILIPSV